MMDDIIQPFLRLEVTTVREERTIGGILCRVH